ncbi:carboxypeptidase-like regulatory domain-containing protein [Sphingobacterium mizutaii]|uniref:carboxypeptidase-like regulatory domain-containing protein n=1 Tax=Sphingobacterium mizutaii TaxID=1010 RepID=UPI002896CD71|nr:carboxypeptidase-like regulatory domain-containing protein [Sphingobacterium mizutaii]
MNKNFDIAYLRKYVNGELSDSEMYAIEKASHEDELLMDVLMGLEEEKKLNSPLEVADLHTAIFERTHPAKVRPISFYRNLSIAASVLLALGIGSIWYLNRDQNKVAETMETVAMDNSAEVPTDTTLNSIHLDSLDGISDEDNLIALATPTEPVQAETAKPGERKQSNKTKRPTVEEILADNQDVFLREVPRADTSTFHDKHDNMIASNEVGSFKRADKSNVIVMNGKAPAKAKITGQVAGVAADRISSLQDVKKLATGRVLDQQSGRPIVSASVRDVKTNDVVMTDSSGQYIMPLTSDNQKLEILSLGYEKELITASNNKIVQLKPSFGALDEVVVVGYGNKTQKVKSEPLVGWVAYKKYINDNSYQTLLGKGSVTLVFDISTFGRPIDISIKKSSNPDLSQKAIQIIQNGPDWKKGNDGKKIEVKINFR